MDPLYTNKWALTWLCVYPATKTTSKWTKMAHISFTVANLIGQLCGAVSHFVYFLKYKSIDLGGAVYAFMGFTSFVALIYITISLYSQRHEIAILFEKLTKIYENRKCIYILCLMCVKLIWIAYLMCVLFFR